MFPRWAPGLNTIAEADDRCCLVEATAVIRLSNQVEHESGMQFRRREKAPNSKSPTELPGASRSWVAIGDDPEVLQQSGLGDVKAKAERPPQGLHIELQRMMSLLAAQMSGQLFDSR